MDPSRVVFFSLHAFPDLIDDLSVVLLRVVMHRRELCEYILQSAQIAREIVRTLVLEPIDGHFGTATGVGVGVGDSGSWLQSASASPIL